MFYLEKSSDPLDNLRQMTLAVKAMTEGEDDAICGLANVSAVIMAYLEEINWAGFYLKKNGRLVLGPFQGLPACTRIELGRGVCGTAAAEARVVRVDDVHSFPGHIACDSASNSEIVLPIFRNGEVCGVLDVDSPRFSRFAQAEAEALGEAARIISSFMDGVEFPL